MINKNETDSHQLLIDMRSLALLTMREISEATGIHAHKLYRISCHGPYKVEYHEGVNLLKLHNEHCGWAKKWEK